MSAYEASPVKRDRWTAARLAALDAAIIEATAADYPVSLRGVFYRVESVGAVDKSDAGYQRVGRQLLKLRREGIIPYEWITDGTRWITKPQTWPSLEEKLRYEQQNYRRALWHDSADEVMMFTEKDAISGVVLPITQQYDVPLGVLRGYCSESFAHNVATAIVASNNERTGTTYVYQLGDHDPSGVDAWRDFTSKVMAFIGGLDDVITEWVEFERLAVTPEQIREFRLPTRPTKRKDTRARGFEGGSVEVDAIPAPELRDLVEQSITQHTDPDRLERLEIVEQEERDQFLQFADIMRGGG